MKKVGIISLGCAKNLVDSENILGLLDHDRYEIVNSVEDSDIVIVNTCGFINDSKRESIQTILDLVPFSKKIVVTGCLVQRYEEEIRKEIPEINLIVPIRDYYRFNELLKTIDDDLTESGGLNDEYRVVSTGTYSAYLKIGEGCSNHCAYCAIPLIRGEFVSREKEDIIKEAKKLANEGYKELIVLEQDTTKYGVDLTHGENIVGLLKELLKIQGLDYIRLLYLYPDEITDELIDLIAKEERLTTYFDIPIQHSEDTVLKHMGRRGNKELLINLFKKIRERVPRPVLRTTLMVGFPGETEEDFENLKKFMEEIKFDHLGAFIYSQEENTPAFSFDNQIDEKTKKRRLNEVMKLQQKISYQNNKNRIGEVMEGLVIGQEKQYYLLRSYWNAPDDVDGKIYFSSNESLKEGDKVKVKITKASVYDLYGEKI